MKSSSEGSNGEVTVIIFIFHLTTINMFLIFYLRFNAESTNRLTSRYSPRCSFSYINRANNIPIKT